MFNNLIRRIRKLEQSATPNMRIIRFSDNSTIEVRENALLQAWKDIVRGEIPDIYAMLKEKHEQGIYDTTGMYWAFEAWDTTNMSEVWADEL